jgi:hypothetical protein
MRFTAALLALLLSIPLLANPSPAAAADWTPDKWAAEDTLEFRTECADEGEHWSSVWLVVVDGHVWVRLGSKAASRMDCNATKMTTSIRIAGERFDGVEMVHTPEMVDRVDEAMADKYFSDNFLIFAKHRYNMKLVPKVP